MLAAGKRSRLPKEYQEVEYIRTTGVQGFTLPIFCDQVEKVRAIYKPTIGNDIATFCGMTDDQDRWDPALFYYINNGNRGASFIFDSTWGLSRVDSERIDATVYCVPGQNAVGVYNGVTVNGGMVSAKHNRKVCVFWSGSSFWNADIAGSELVLFGSQNTILAHLISAYRVSDRKPGMYDVINNIFHTNQRTGEFLVGPDVN